MQADGGLRERIARKWRPVVLGDEPAPCGIEGARRSAIGGPARRTGSVDPRLRSSRVPRSAPACSALVRIDCGYWWMRLLVDARIGGCAYRRMRVLVDACIGVCAYWWMRVLVDARIGGCAYWWMRVLVDALPCSSPLALRTAGSASAETKCVCGGRGAIGDPLQRPLE